MKHVWMKIAVLAGLTACGPLADNDPVARFGQSLVALVSNEGDSEAEAQAASLAGLTRAQIEQIPTNLLRLSVISIEATDVLAEVGQNGTKVTWANAVGISFTFDRGVLVASRGLGFDLMGADVDAAVRSLSSGGNYSRTLDFLDGEDQIQQISVQCQSVVTDREVITITERDYDTAIIVETCSGDGQEFRNTFWRDRNGVIWQSRQWLSPQLGYIGYQRL